MPRSLAVSGWDQLHTSPVVLVKRRPLWTPRRRGRSWSWYQPDSSSGYRSSSTSRPGKLRLNPSCGCVAQNNNNRRPSASFWSCLVLEISTNEPGLHATPFSRPSTASSSRCADLTHSTRATGNWCLASALNTDRNDRSNPNYKTDRPCRSLCSKIPQPLSLRLQWPPSTSDSTPHSTPADIPVDPFDRDHEPPRKVQDRSLPSLHNKASSTSSSGWEKPPATPVPFKTSFPTHPKIRARGRSVVRPTASIDLKDKKFKFPPLPPLPPTQTPAQPQISLPMASGSSYSYSTPSSDFSTPRSSSPSSSVISTRSSNTSISNKRMSISSRRMTDLNPMSAVDVQAIEAKMKMASLDQLRGYAQHHYGEVKQYTSTEYIPQSKAAGYQILREPTWNRGTLVCMSAAMSAPNSACTTSRFPSLPHSSHHIMWPRVTWVGSKPWCAIIRCAALYSHSTCYLKKPISTSAVFNKLRLCRVRHCSPLSLPLFNLACS